MSEATAKRKPSPPAQLLESYRALDGVFDEVLDADGQPRAHYAAVLGELETLGVAELKRRWDTAGRYVHEQGITYNIYGDARGMERPWLLDPLPFVISAADWRTLETALIQRATLIDHILADCYGPQELLRTGRLPPALIFAQADFLRPCHGVKVAHDRHLHLYAADLARSPDGRWWVTSDRTQIPTGSGYALANRLVTSRILPEPFRDCHVHRLAGFSARCRPRWRNWRRGAPTIRASCCSRPVRSTKPISSRPTSHATSATRWSKARTSPCATTAFF